jgi:mono/diheme cytochrome c family protein
LTRAAALASLACLLTAAAAAQDPQVDYILQCQGCHLADGSGSPGAVPDLRGSLARLASAPGGREYLVRVPGAAQSPLSDQRLAAVLDWMIREFGPAEQAAAVEPYRAEEVARWRAAPYLEVESVRRALLNRSGSAAAAYARPPDP